MLADEIYSELTYGGKRHVSIASLPGMRERTVVLNGFSKAFSMTGWRLGYAAAPREIIAAMTKIHQLSMLSALRRPSMRASPLSGRALKPTGRTCAIW